MSTYMVLNDGETFAPIAGCKMVSIDDDELQSICEATECEPDEVIAEVYKGRIGDVVQEF